MNREQLEAIDKKHQLVAQAYGRCEVCGKLLESPQLAHRIPQTKVNVQKYGKSVIHHELNLAVVCSLACNSKVLLNPATNPVDAEKLVKKIKGALC